MYLLVIGGQSDIGLAIAKKFYTNGFHTYLTKRNNKQLNEEVYSFKNKETKLKFVNFNLLDFDLHKTFYDSLEPKPDIVICAAGITHDNMNLINNFDKVKQTIDTNFTAYVSLLNIISEDFRVRDSGSIIAISSVAGERGRGSNYIYGSTKAAFTAYLSGLRNKLNHTKVNIITVKPGFIDTKMTKNMKFNKFLRSNPETVAKDVYTAWKKNKLVLYTPWYWKYIMFLVKLIPETIFKKLKL